MLGEWFCEGRGRSGGQQRYFDESCWFCFCPHDQPVSRRLIANRSEVRKAKS